jgi:AcrR family transcriptional regulator
MSESGTPAPQQHSPSSRGSATALRIERSAVALINEHGYDGTTVDMICAASGVSQRTFFNHFPTKDAAIIGVAEPRLDEQQVRAFIASSGTEILTDAIGLVAFAALAAAGDAELMSARMRAITSSPTLMHRQMERLAAIEGALAEVIEYRLARVSAPHESPAEIREQAVLTAHLLAGVMRYTATQVMRSDSRDIASIIARTHELLSRVLPKLGGGAATTRRDS